MRDTSPSSQLQAYMWIWNRFTEQGYGTSARCDHIKHTTWQCWQWKWTQNMIIFIGKFRELFDSIRFAPHEYSTCLVNHLRPQREASKLLEKCLLVFEASHYIYSLNAPLSLYTDCTVCSLWEPMWKFFIWDYCYSHPISVNLVLLHVQWQRAQHPDSIRLEAQQCRC